VPGFFIVPGFTGKVDADFPNQVERFSIGILFNGRVSGFYRSSIGVMIEQTNRYNLRTRPVECPRCKATFMFRRPARLRFDQHGFESHSLCCEYCRTFMTGVIDPLTGKLVVSTE
jgi:hypothetical protein